MPDHMKPIEVNRPLTEDERVLLQWMLDNGNEEARAVSEQLRDARVVALCPCGCASIDLAVGELRGSVKAGMSVVSDYCWRSPDGFLFGAFVFTCEGWLAGLDLWSVDGQATPSVLPRPEQLYPYDKQA